MPNSSRISRRRLLAGVLPAPRDHRLSERRPRADARDLHRRPGHPRPDRRALPADREEAQHQGAVRGHQLADQSREDALQQGAADDDADDDGRSRPRSSPSARSSSRSCRPKSRTSPTSSRARSRAAACGRTGASRCAASPTTRKALPKRPDLLRRGLGAEIQGAHHRDLDAHHAGDRAAARRDPSRDQEAARAVPARMAGRHRAHEGAAPEHHPGLDQLSAGAAAQRDRRVRPVHEPGFAHDAVPQVAGRAGRPGHAEGRASSRCRPASRWSRAGRTRTPASPSSTRC